MALLLGGTAADTSFRRPGLPIFGMRVEEKNKLGEDNKKLII